MSSKRQWLAAALLVVAGCGGTVDVLTNYDQAYDFTGKHTYKWQNLPLEEIFPMETADPVGLDALIRATVDEELAAKGYRQAEDATLTLTYVVLANERVLAEDTPSTTDWDPTKDPTRYGSAVLAIDFLDSSSHDRVWRGAAMTDFRPGKGRKRVRETVSRIMEEFPPQK